jgi:hypothetical protein
MKTLEQVQTGGFDLRSQRSTVITEIAIAFPVAAALWLGVYFILPPLTGMEDTLARLAVALKWSCVAILFCFVTAIEAVAHERLRSAAIDPLSGHETRRMNINLRYLQHTLEQLALFVPGLFGLAFYSSDGGSMRAVAATAAVWMISRFAFWIGYHYGSLHRAAGAPGMVQSIVVLLYVCVNFGFEMAGFIGAITPLVLFGCIEAFLVRATRSIGP